MNFFKAVSPLFMDVIIHLEDPKESVEKVLEARRIQDGSWIWVFYFINIYMLILLKLETTH